MYYIFASYIQNSLAYVYAKLTSVYIIIYYIIYILFYFLLLKPLKLGSYSNPIMCLSSHKPRCLVGSLPLYHCNFLRGVTYLWGSPDCLLYHRGSPPYCRHWRNEELPSFSEG